MNRRGAVLGLGGLVLVGALSWWAGSGDAPEQVVEVRTPLVPGDAARGRHLVQHVLACGACHGHDLGGAVVDAGILGEVWAPNLTPAGGERTSEAWVLALRRGEAVDGRRLKLMPPSRWGSLSESDLADVLAALAELRPVDRSPPPASRSSSLGWLTSLAEDDPDGGVRATPAPEAPDAAYGAYLAALAGCHDCHGEDLGGRTSLLGRAPPVVADPGAPFGGARFEAAVRRGRGADGRTLGPRMPWIHHAGLTDTEVDALWAHVRRRTGLDEGDALAEEVP